MERGKVVFVDTVHPVLWDRLNFAGFDCQEAYELQREELKHFCSDAAGLVIRSRVAMDADFLSACSNLRWIARSGSGMENIDLSYAAARGITCFNSPEGNADAVGEHTVGMLLMLLNHLHRVDIEVRQGIWRRAENRGTELNGKTVALIGLGTMGKAVAQRLLGFGCRVLAYDKYQKNQGVEGVEEVEMDEVYTHADIVSLHLPLTPETRGLVDYAWLKAFEKSIYLINTARGPIVSSTDLWNSLQSGKVKGACLDVLDIETPSFEKIGDLPAVYQQLFASPQVVFSPHIAGWTHESYYKLSSVLADKILAQF